MPTKTIPILDIQYQLVPGAAAICVPTPVTQDNHALVYLKTNQFISLAYNGYLKVHTGIFLIDYPELILNTNPHITIQTIAHIYSIPELEEEDGIEVISPKVLTSEYSKEIIVTIHNTHKAIFNAEKGENICILELLFAPKVNFSLVN